MGLVSAKTRSAASTVHSGLKRGNSGFGLVTVAGMGRFGPLQRLIHDAADGAGATAALGAATQAAIDLTGRARTVLRTARRADVLVAQNIA